MFCFFNYTEPYSFIFGVISSTSMSLCKWSYTILNSDPTLQVTLLFFYISVTQLKTFFETMRTRFGKISTKKSGQGAKQLSHREKFIYNNFRFLKTHIKRTTSRQSDTVSIFNIIELNTKSSPWIHTFINTQHTTNKTFLTALPFN